MNCIPNFVLYFQGHEKIEKFLVEIRGTMIIILKFNNLICNKFPIASESQLCICETGRIVPISDYCKNKMN